MYSENIDLKAYELHSITTLLIYLHFFWKDKVSVTAWRVHFKEKLQSLIKSPSISSLCALFITNYNDETLNNNKRKIDSSFILTSA